MIVLNAAEYCLAFLVASMALAGLVFFALSVMMATVAAVTAAAVLVRASMEAAFTTYAPPPARMTPRDPEMRLRYLRKLRVLIDEQVFALEGELTRCAVDPRTPPAARTSSGQRPS